MEHTDEMNIVLRYNGPAVESGAMSVYDAAAAMVAFSDFVVEAAKHTFGGDTKVRAEVQGFRHGSFATDLLFYVAGAGTVLYASAKAANEVLGTIKTSFELYKHLKGDKPAKVEPLN